MRTKMSNLSRPQQSVSQAQNPQTQSPVTFTFQTVKLSTIPQQKRLGRTSRFLKLFEALKVMQSDSALQFPIEKYTTIQGLRKKLSDMGFTITTRSNKVINNGVTTDSIMAYVYKTPPEVKPTQ